MLSTPTRQQATRACPICRQTQIDALHYQRFTLPEDHPLGQGYDVVSCVNCSFLYADIDMTQAEYDHFYADLSRYESAVSSGSGSTPVDAERHRGTAAMVARMLPDTDARILDFGCAGGGLIRALKKVGYHRLSGIDIAAGCVAQVRSIEGVSAHVGSLFDLPPGIGTFDCVLITHVLEHVEDVRGAIANLSSLLAPGGLLYLEVPDASRYADFILAPFQDFNTEHINHFSQITLDSACGVMGLALVEGGERVFEVAPRMPFPAAYGFWRKDEDARPRAFRVDGALRTRIETYIQRSNAIMDGYRARVAALLDRSPEIVVWGTGQLTLKLLGETDLGRARIHAFVDSNPMNQGQVLHGVPVIAPDALDRTDLPILIASSIHFEAIATQVRERLGDQVEIVGVA